MILIKVVLIFSNPYSHTHTAVGTPQGEVVTLFIIYVHTPCSLKTSGPTLTHSAGG